MTVKEYSNKVNKTVEKILNLCKKLGIKLKDENSILSDDDIALLDFELEEEEKLNSGGGDDSSTGSGDGGIDIDFECLATGSAKLNNFVSDGGSLSVLMSSLSGIGSDWNELTTSSTYTDNCFKCCSDLVKKVEDIKARYERNNANVALLFAYYDGDFLDENNEFIDVDKLSSHIDSHRGINDKFASNILEQAGLVNESTFFTNVFGSDKYLQENGLLDIDLIESDRLSYGIGNSLNYMTIISGSNELAKGLSNGDFNDENGKIDINKFNVAKDKVFGDLDEEYYRRGDSLNTIYGLERIVENQAIQNALSMSYERELNIAKQELESLGAQKDLTREFNQSFDSALTTTAGFGNLTSFLMDTNSDLIKISKEYGEKLEKVANLEGKLAAANMNYYSLYSLYPNFSELNFNETKIADYKIVMEKNDLPVDFSGVPFAKDSVSIFDKIVYYDKDGNEIKNVSDYEAAKFFVEKEKNGNDVSDVLDNLDFVSFKDAYNVYKYLDYVVDPIYTVENKKDTSDASEISEKDIINYLFNTGNNAQVEAYLKSMKSITDYRQGVEQAAEVMKKIENYESIAALKAEMNGTEITSVNFSNIWNNAVNYSNSGNVQSNYIDVSQGIGTILAAEGFADGVKTHFNGLFNLMNADGVADVDTYKISSLVTALNNKYGAGVIDSALGTNSFGNIFSGVYENFNSIGNMAPTILAGYVGGFLGVPALGSLSMGMSIVGNTVDQAMAEGMTSLEAWTYGILSGASEGATSYFLGAIPGLKQVNNMSDRLGNVFGGNPMISYLAKMFSEGVEESTQSVIEPLLYNIVTGRPAKSIDIVDVAKSGIHGAITAGFLSSGTLVIDSYRYSLMDIPTKELVSIMNKYEGRDLTKDSVIKKLKTDLEKYRIKYDVDDASLIELNYHFKHDKQFKQVRDKFDPLNVISSKIDMDNLKKYYANVDMTQKKNLEKFEFDIEFYQDLYGIEVDKNEILSSLNSEVLAEDNLGQFTKVNVDDILELNSRMQGENSNVDRQLLESLVNDANESSLNSRGKILQLAYNIVEKNVFGSQSKSMAMLVAMQNLKMNGIESSIDPNVLSSFISGIGTIGLSQEHLLMLANKSDLSIDDAMKFSNITEDGLNDTNRDVVLSQAIKNYLDSLIKEARKFCNISNEDSLQNDNINKYLNDNKANSDKNIDESYYENYSKNNRENAVPIEENIGGLITTKIRTDFKNISQEEKRVISKFLNKDSKDITVEDYKRYLDVNKVLKKLFKNVPKGFDINDEKFLFGISDKSEIDDNILKKTIYESVNNGSSLIDIITKLIGNNHELVSEIGLYTLIDAMNQYAYKYLDDNNISLEKGKLPIEMLAAKDPEFYEGAYEDFSSVLEHPLNAADDSYSLATGKLVNIVKKIKGSLLGYNEGMEDRIPHSTKTKDSAIRKVYNDWVSDLENNGYKLNDMNNPKNDSGEYVLVGINESNKGQIFTINKDGLIIDSDGNVVSSYNFKLEKYIPNDLLRYTIISDGKNYVSTVASTLIGLEEQGIKILKAKFLWPGSFYQGVNLTLQMGNQNFELQIHTNESFYAKDDATHMFYEIVRNKIFNSGDNRSSIQQNADYAQVLMQMQVEVPQNAEKFKLISTFIEVAMGINKNISSNKMNEIMEFLNNLENKRLDKNSQKRVIKEFIESIASNEEFSLGNFLVDYFELTDNDMMSFMDKYAVSISNDGIISSDIQKTFIEDFLASGLSLREIFQIDWISEYYNGSNIMSFFDGMSNLDIFKILFKGDNINFIIEKFGKNGNNLLINLINQGNANVLYNSVISSEPYFSGMSNKQALFNLIKLFNQLNSLGIDLNSINMDSSLTNFYDLYNSKGIDNDDATMKFISLTLLDKSSMIVEGKDVMIADQGSVRKAFKDFKVSLAERIEQKKLQNRLINQVVENFTVNGEQLISKKEAVEFLQRLDLGINNGGTGGICSYADVAKLIFEMFDGIEIEFEEIFGFSMYTDGRLNQEQLIVDLFTKINDYEYIKKIANDTNFDGSKSKVLASAAVNEKCYDVEIIYDYLVNKVGLDIDKSQLVPRNIYSNFKSNGIKMSQQEIKYNVNETLSKVNAAINNGEHVSISCRVATRYEDGKHVKLSDKDYAPMFELIDINGNVRKIDSSHIMPIRGIDSSGRLVVETWDQLFYVDIEYALSKGMQFSINSLSVNGKSVVDSSIEVSDAVVDKNTVSENSSDVGAQEVINNKNIGLDFDVNNVVELLENLKYKRISIPSYIKSYLSSNVRKYLYKNTNEVSGLNQQIMENGLYHFTDAADKIIKSGYIKPSGFNASYGNPKTFFFNGVPSVGAFATNLDSIPIKVSAVKVMPTEDVVNSSNLRIRYVDDMAISYDGKFNLDGMDVRKCYFGLVVENGELKYKEISEELYKTYENRDDSKNLIKYVSNKKNVMDIKGDFLTNIAITGKNLNLGVDENMYASQYEESFYGVDPVFKSDIDYVIRTHNSRYYKNQDALDRLRRFSNPDDINYGNYNIITSTGNARNILMKYTPQQIRNYINQLDSNVQKISRIVNQQSNVSNNYDSRISSRRNFFEYIYSNSRNNITHSLGSLVRDFVLGDLNGSNLYGILVDFGSVMKKVPSKSSYISYLNELRRLGCDIKAQSRDHNGNKDYERNQFNHVFSSNWINIDPTQRLYFHAEYEDTFTFLKSFAEKCNERGIPFYFKTADFEFDGRRSFVAYQSSLTRTESAVIYSNDEYMMQYIDICNEIKSEHSEIKFYNPPIGLAVLDNWLGYGAQPDVNLCKNKGVSASFNAVRARVLELSIKQGLKKFVNSYGSNIIYGNKTVDNLLIDSLFNYVVSVNRINSDNEKNKLYGMLVSNKEYYLGQLKQDVSSIKVGNYVVHDVSKVRGYMYAAYCSDNEVILKLISDSMRDVCVEYDVDPDNFAFNLNDKKRMQMLSNKLRQNPNDVKIISDIKYIIESHDKKYYSGDALYRLKQFIDPRSSQYGNYYMISSNMGARNVLKNYTPQDIARYLSRFDGMKMSNMGYVLKDGESLRGRMGIQFFANKGKSDFDRSSIIDENMYASDSDLTVVNNNQLSVNVNSFVKLDGRTVLNRILFTKESVNELFGSINESRYYSSQYSKEEVLFGLVKAFNEDSYYVSLFAENNPIASEFISLYYENKSSLTRDQAIYDFVNKYVVDRTIPGSKVRLDQFNVLDILSPFNRNKYGVAKLRDNLFDQLNSKIDIVNKKVLYSVLRSIESSRVLTGISGYKKYSLISQYIFNMYKGQEGKFERDFGFPMYLDGGLNNIQLQLDMLISIHGKQFDGKSLKQILDDRNNGKISFEYDDKSVIDYLISRGIITSEEALVQETLFDTRKDFEYKNIKDVVNNLLIRIDELLSNGNKVMLSLSSETDAYGNMINIRDENGNVISRVLNGNSITILGISSDGKLIVELSGRNGYIDLENELIFGRRFSIDSLHLEVNNLLEVGIEDKTLGMEHLDLGNVSFGEIEDVELRELTRSENRSFVIDENMYASEDDRVVSGNNQQKKEYVKDGQVVNVDLTLDEIIDNFLRTPSSILMSDEQKKQFFEQVDRYVKLSRMSSKKSSFKLNENGKVIFEEGTLIHGIGRSPYNDFILESISKYGILSGQAFGIVEESETEYCADFFRVSHEMSVEDYRNIQGKGGCHGYTPFDVKIGRDIRDENNIAFVIVPNEDNNELLSYDAYRIGTDASNITKTFVNYLPIEDYNEGSAVLFGVPRNCINGIVVSNKLLENTEKISKLINLFPSCYIMSKYGDVIYDPNLDIVNADVLYFKGSSVVSKVKLKSFESDLKTNSAIYEKEVGKFELLMDLIFGNCSETEIRNILLDIGYQVEGLNLNTKSKLRDLVRLAMNKSQYLELSDKLDTSNNEFSLESRLEFYKNQIDIVQNELKKYNTLSNNLRRLAITLEGSLFKNCDNSTVRVILSMLWQKGNITDEYINSRRESISLKDNSLDIKYINLDSENIDMSNEDGALAIDENMYANDSGLTVVNNNQLSVDVNSFVKLDGRSVLNRVLFTKESVNELFGSINESRYYSSQYSKEEVLFGLVRAFNEDSYYVSLFAENNPIASEFISLYYENKSSLTSDQAIYDFVNKYVVDRTIPGSKVRLDQFGLLDILSPFNRNKYGVNTLRSNLISHLSSKIDVINKKVLYSVLRSIESSGVLTGISGYKKYSLISQYIFDMYKGQEGKFERDFGFSMYLDGGLNNIQLQLDMLISTYGKQFDGKSLKQILDDRNNGKISFKYDDKSVIDYLISRDIITSEEALVQETLYDTRKDFEYKNIKDVVNNLLIRIDDVLSNGNKVMLSLSSETDAYGNMISIRDENGNIISRVLNGNSITILGISSDGKLIVELSGRNGYIDLENELIFGRRFSIDSLHLEVNNLLDVGIEEDILGMERLDLGNVSYGEIDQDELQDLVRKEDGTFSIDENMYASGDSISGGVLTDEIIESLDNFVGLYDRSLADLRMCVINGNKRFISREYVDKINNVSVAQIRAYLRYRLSNFIIEANKDFKLENVLFANNNYKDSNDGYIIFTPSKMVMIPTNYDYGLNIDIFEIFEMLYDNFDSSNYNSVADLAEDFGYVVINLNSKGNNIYSPKTISSNQYKMLEDFNQMIKDCVLKSDSTVGLTFGYNMLSNKDTYLIEHGKIDQALSKVYSKIDDNIDNPNDINLDVDVSNIVHSQVDIVEEEQIELSLDVDWSLNVKGAELGINRSEDGYLKFDDKILGVSKVRQFLTDSLDRMSSYFGDAGKKVSTMYRKGFTTLEILNLLKGDEKNKFLAFLNNTRQGQFIKLLTDEEIKVLYDWTNPVSFLYREINEKLYNKKGLLKYIDDIPYDGEYSVKKIVEILDQAIDKYVIDEDILLYRAISLDNLYNVPLFKYIMNQVGDISDIDLIGAILESLIGEKIDNYGYLSTSPSYTTSLSMHPDYPIVLQINASAGTKGAYINQISAVYNSENEMLLARDTSLIIRNVSVGTDIYGNRKVFIKCDISYDNNNKYTDLGDLSLYDYVKTKVDDGSLKQIIVEDKERFIVSRYSNLTRLGNLLGRAYNNDRGLNVIDKTGYFITLVDNDGNPVLDKSGKVQEQFISTDEFDRLYVKDKYNPELYKYNEKNAVFVQINDNLVLENGSKVIDEGSYVRFGKDVDYEVLSDFDFENKYNIIEVSVGNVVEDMSSGSVGMDNSSYVDENMYSSEDSDLDYYDDSLFYEDTSDGEVDTYNRELADLLSKNIDDEDFITDKLSNIEFNDMLEVFKYMSLENIEELIGSYYFDKLLLIYQYKDLCGVLGIDVNKNGLLGILSDNDMIKLNILNDIFKNVDMSNELNVIDYMNNALLFDISLKDVISNTKFINNSILEEFLSKKSERQIRKYINDSRNNSILSNILDVVSSNKLVSVLGMVNNVENIVSLLSNSKKMELLRFDSLSDNIRSLLEVRVDKSSIIGELADINIDDGKIVTIEEMVDIISDDNLLMNIFDSVIDGSDLEIDYSKEDILFAFVKLFQQLDNLGYKLDFFEDLELFYDFVHNSKLINKSDIYIRNYLKGLTTDSTSISSNIDMIDKKIGVDQHIIADIFREGLENNPKIMERREVLINQVITVFPGMSKQLAIRFLKRIDIEREKGGTGGVCNYADICNFIFESFKGKEELFEKKFGFPMYTNGKLNGEQLLCDIFVKISGPELIKLKTYTNGENIIASDGKYSIIDKKYVYLTNNASTTNHLRAKYRLELISKYLVEHGVISDGSNLGQIQIFNTFVNDYSDMFVSRRLANNILLEVKSSLEKGYHVSISSYMDKSPLELYDERRQVYETIDNAHIMTIKAIDCGLLVVDTWRRTLYIDLCEALRSGVRFNINELTIDGMVDGTFGDSTLVADDSSRLIDEAMYASEEYKYIPANGDEFGKYDVKKAEAAFKEYLSISKSDGLSWRFIKEHFVPPFDPKKRSKIENAFDPNEKIRYGQKYIYNLYDSASRSWVPTTVRVHSENYTKSGEVRDWSIEIKVGVKSLQFEKKLFVQSSRTYDEIHLPVNLSMDEKRYHYREMNSEQREYFEKKWNLEFYNELRRLYNSKSLDGHKNEIYYNKENKYVKISDIIDRNSGKLYITDDNLPLFYQIYTDLLKSGYVFGKFNRYNVNENILLSDRIAYYALKYVGNLISTDISSFLNIVDPDDSLLFYLDGGEISVSWVLDEELFGEMNIDDFFDKNELIKIRNNHNISYNDWISKYDMLFSIVKTFDILFNKGYLNLYFEHYLVRNLYELYRDYYMKNGANIDDKQIYTFIDKYLDSQIDSDYDNNGSSSIDENMYTSENSDLDYYDDSVFYMDDDGDVLQDGETLGGKIGLQFFAESSPSTRFDVDESMYASEDSEVNIIEYVDSILAGKSDNEIFEYIRNNISTLNEYYQLSVIQKFMKDNFSYNVGLLTRYIINNLSNENTISDLIEMVRLLDDDNFESFVVYNKNGKFFEDDEIFERSLNFNSSHNLEGFSSDIQLKFINNDKYISYIKLKSFKIASLLFNLSIDNVSIFLDKIDFVSMSLADKLQIIIYDLDVNIDSNKQKIIIEKSGILKNIDSINDYNLKKLFSKIKDKNYLYQLFNDDNVYKRLDYRKDNFSSAIIYELISLLDSSSQVEFINNKRLLDKVTYSELNNLLITCSKEVVEYLFQIIPTLIDNLKISTMFELYLKMNNDYYLEQFKLKLLDSVYLFDIEIPEKIAQYNLLSKFNEVELNKIYGRSDLDSLFKYVNICNDENSKLYFSKLIDNLIDNVSEIRGSVLVDNIDILTSLQIDKIISKVDGLRISSLLQIESKLSTKQFELLLSKIDIGNLFTELDNDKIYNYILNKVKNDSLIFSDVKTIEYPFINISKQVVDRTFEILKYVQLDDKLKFISEELVEDDNYRDSMKNLILSKPELVKDILGYKLGYLLNSLSLDERMKIYDVLSFEQLISIYRNSKDNMLIDDKDYINSLFLNNYSLIENYDLCEFIKLIDYDQQIKFIENIDASTFDFYWVRDLIKSLNNEDVIRVLFKKMFFNNSKLITMNDDGILRILNIMDNKNLQIFVDTCSDDILIRSFSLLRNDILENSIMNRFKDNVNIFVNTGGMLAYSRLSINNKQIVDEFILDTFKRYFSNTWMSELVNSMFVEVFELSKLNYAYSLGYLTLDKLQLLHKMFKNNPHVFKTLNVELLNPEIASIGDLFIEKFSRYQVESDMIVNLYKNNPVEFKIFGEIVKTFINDDSLNILSLKISRLLKYFEELIDYKRHGNNVLLSFNTYKNFDIDFSKFNDKMYKQFFEYVLNNSYLFSDQFFTVVDDKITFDQFDENYIENYNKYVDDLFRNASTLEDKKNILLTKLFGLSTQEVNLVLTGYYNGLVGYVDNDNSVFKYLSNMKKVYDIDDISFIEQLYMEMERSSVDILYIVEEAKKLYAKSYIERLSTTKDKIGQIMSENSKVVFRDDFSFDMIENSMIIDYNGKKIPVVSLVDDFNLIVNSTGAFGEMGLINDNYSDSWNLSERTKNHGICCSYIGNSQLGTADVEGNGVLFGFYGFSEESIIKMAPFDIYSSNDKIEITSGKQAVYLMADKITSQTRNVYNEFVIERTEWRTDINSKYSGIQPDYVVVFADWDSKLKENALKAAYDFNPPLQIIYIDKNKVARNEVRKIEDKLMEFDNNPENIQMFIDAIDLHESNRTGFGHSQNVVDVDEIFSTDRIMDSFDDFIVNVERLYKNNLHIPNMKEKIIDILNKMCDILRDEKNKFELGEFHVHSKTTLDLDIDDMIDYLEGYIDDFKENVW